VSPTVGDIPSPGTCWGWCHLGMQPVTRQWGGQPYWGLLGLLMGLSSVGPCCPHGPRARGSPGLGSGAGRKPSPGRTSAMSMPPVEPHVVAWPWTRPSISDPLPSSEGFLTLFFGSSRSWWRRAHGGTRDPMGPAWVQDCAPHYHQFYTISTYFNKHQIYSWSLPPSGPPPSPDALGPSPGDTQPPFSHQRNNPDHLPFITA